MFKPTKVDAEIDLIVADPQPGDRFHEMYNFWGYVVHREGDNVVIMFASSPCTFPEDATIKYCTVVELKRWLGYEGIPGYNGIPGYWVDGAGRGHDVTGWYVPSEEKKHE